jgi:hypothetical protein
VDIIADGVILEVTDLAHASARGTFHCNVVARGVTRVDASSYRKHNRDGTVKGCFKTLTIDPSAGCTRVQRWAQKDQVEDCRSHLVSSHGTFKTMTITTVAQPVNLVRRAQNDQAGGRVKPHLVSGHGEFTNMTTAISAEAVPVNITREHVGRALHQWRNTHSQRMPDSAGA